MNSPSQYKPDTLSSGGATERPFQEAVPHTGSIVPTLVRLAMRRLPGFGFGAVHGKAPSTVSTPVTMGSHGKVK